MAKLFMALFLALVATQAVAARPTPDDASFNDQKNFLTYGGLGGYSGIGSNGLPFGGLGGAVGGGFGNGIAGGLGPGNGVLGGVGGTGGTVGDGTTGGLGGGVGGGVDGGAGGGAGLPYP